MAVWSGQTSLCLCDLFFLRRHIGFALGGTSVPENELAPYIQQAIDQINFVIGDPATSEPGTFLSSVCSQSNKNAPSAALRAALGRSDPFTLNYVEVGNEVKLDLYLSVQHPLIRIWF